MCASVSVWTGVWMGSRHLERGGGETTGHRPILECPMGAFSRQYLPMALKDDTIGEPTGGSYCPYSELLLCSQIGQFFFVFFI